MKLFQSLLFSVLFVSALIFTGCNEEQTTSVTPDFNTPGLSKLTLPANAVIQTATFNIFVSVSQARTIDIHKINVPWDEATETWTTFVVNNPTPWDPTVLGSFDASTGGYKSVDIKALVQSWIADPTTNNGVLLNQPDPWPGPSIPLIFYDSRDLPNPPYLEITYKVGEDEPVTVRENAFADTYVWSTQPDYKAGNDRYLLQTRLADYIKYVLVKFDIEGTPEEECYQEETAWASNGTVPGSLRYVTRGNWATYLTFAGVAKTVNIYAGQTNYVGTATLTPVIGGVDIDINLEGGWELNPMVGETVKIQGYAVTPPAKNPAPGQFTTYKGTDLTVTVPVFNFYGIHLDVRKAITCP